MYELRYYQSANREQPLVEWLEGIADAQTRARIQARLNRLALGNFGDHKAVGGGVVELRMDWGPGYRVYFARIGHGVLLLLCGGDKTTQQRDIDRAKAYLEDYKTRASKSRATSPSRPGRSRA